MSENGSGNIPVYNKRGQRFGPKGIATREEVMNAALRLLQHLPVWQITPSDIASAANIRQPNFYIYFDSVEEVILALMHRATAESPDYRKSAPVSLEGPDGLRWIREIAEGSVAEWQKYGPVLRVVEMLADNDVPEFREARRARLDSLRDILAEAVTAAQARGDLNATINVRFVVYSALSLIRVMAEHYNLTRGYPMSHAEIVSTISHMTHLSLTGKACLEEAAEEPSGARTRRPARP